MWAATGWTGSCGRFGLALGRLGVAIGAAVLPLAIVCWAVARSRPDALDSGAGPNGFAAIPAAGLALGALSLALGRPERAAPLSAWLALALNGLNLLLIALPV